jgi:DNA-binding beta-propeller fold protein YncE
MRDLNARKQPLMKPFSALLLCCGLAGSAQAQEATALLTLDKTIPLEKVEGRIDHLGVDVAGQRLFVAALSNNTVEVLDLKAGRTIRSLPGFAEPQGIAYVAEFDRLFVANGKDGSCRVLDGHSLTTVRTIELGEDADNVRYDEKAKRIYVGYGGGALAVIDAKTGAKLADIKLAGHPESFRLETDGPRIFVNVPKAEHIAVVDREKGEVIGTWPIKEAKSNFPLSLDEANHRLFTGCRNPAAVLVYDFAGASGRLVTQLPICRDTDDLFYDAAIKLLYVSCGQGIIEVIRQTGPDSYNTVRSIPTAAGARTSLFVPELKLLCLAVPHRGAQPAEIRVFKTP